MLNYCSLDSPTITLKFDEEKLSDNVKIIAYTEAKKSHVRADPFRVNKNENLKKDPG